MIPSISTFGDDFVLLKPFLPKHIKHDYLNWLNDPKVMQYTESRFEQHTFESVRDYVERSNADKSSILFRIVVNSKKHVGNLRVSRIDQNHKTAYIGIIIGDGRFRGCGVGPRAILLAARFCFEHLALQKLIAGMYACNVASIRAFEKSGLRREALLPKHHIYNGMRIDGVLMGLFCP